MLSSTSEKGFHLSHLMIRCVQRINVCTDFLPIAITPSLSRVRLRPYNFHHRPHHSSRPEHYTRLFHSSLRSLVPTQNAELSSPVYQSSKRTRKRTSDPKTSLRRAAVGAQNHQDKSHSLDTQSSVIAAEKKVEHHETNKDRRYADCNIDYNCLLCSRAI